MENQKLQERYLEKFDQAIKRKKPLTAKEVERFTNIDTKTFSKVNVPILRKLGLLLILPNYKINQKLLKKFYQIRWGAQSRGCYYFFTPMTSKINLHILKIFDDYMKDWQCKDEVLNNYNLLMNLLMEYELLANVKPKYLSNQLPLEATKMINAKKSEKDVVDFIESNITALSEPLQSEIALKKIKEAGIVVDPLSEKEEFKRLRKMILNFTLNGDSDKEKYENFPVAIYPIMLQRMYNIKFVTNKFVDAFKSNVDFEDINN